jgi:hypothetical protein
VWQDAALATEDAWALAYYLGSQRGALSHSQLAVSECGMRCAHGLRAWRAEALGGVDKALDAFLHNRFPRVYAMQREAWDMSKDGQVRFALALCFLQRPLLCGRQFLSIAGERLVASPVAELEDALHVFGTGALL